MEEGEMAWKTVGGGSNRGQNVGRREKMKSCGSKEITGVQSFAPGAPNESIIQNHINIALLNVL